MNDLKLTEKQREVEEIEVSIIPKFCRRGAITYKFFYWKTNGVPFFKQNGVSPTIETCKMKFNTFARKQSIKNYKFI